MTTTEMLRAIQFSENENCANIAKRILKNETTIEHELKYCGSFMRAVLNGDYERAIEYADLDNKSALLQYRLSKAI